MTATEQHATALFPHQNGRKSPTTTVSCLASNVGSITEFLLNSTHSTVSTSVNIPTSEENNDETLSSRTPTIVVHTSSEPSLDVLPTSINSVVNGSADNDNEPSISVSKEKLGHRRVDETGNVTYKRVMVDDLMKSLQIGLRYLLEKHHQPQRQVLVHDFQQVETQSFPSEGTDSTPSHPYGEFRLKTYAQIAFSFFRNTFGVDPTLFVRSLCDRDLRELPNPGASGSIFYITADDTYVIKTVSKKEARFLLSLLPGYYMNLTQNPFTLLPKYFGLYCYQNANKNIRFVIMNNLIPSNVKIHEKYDLKGSIYKRKASEEERKRDLPTLKDNDFKSLYNQALTIETFFYDQLVQTIDDDVRVLSSFGIMDYSLLLGIHNITKEVKSTTTLTLLPDAIVSSSSEVASTNTFNTHEDHGTINSADSGITVSSVSNLPTYVQYLRVIEYIRAQEISSVRSLSVSDHQNENIETASIQTVKADIQRRSVQNNSLTSESSLIQQSNSKSPLHAVDNPASLKLSSALIGGDVWYNRQNLSRLAMDLSLNRWAGIPAVNKNGDLLLLYVGIIDILQDYRLRKKLEHAFKSTLVTREEISVCNPTHYGVRFVEFLCNRVFRKEGSKNVIFSDSQSNADQITLHSSRIMHASSSSHRSQMSEDDQSSIINPKCEIPSSKP